MLSMAKTITIKTVCNFNYSQTLIINEEPRTEKKKSFYNGGGKKTGLLPNSDFNTACRIHLTFDKVEPLMAPERSQIKAFLRRLYGGKQDESLLCNPPHLCFTCHHTAEKMLQLLHG